MKAIVKSISVDMKEVIETLKESENAIIAESLILFSTVFTMVFFAIAIFV